MDSVLRVEKDYPAIKNELKYWIHNEPVLASCKKFGLSEEQTIIELCKEIESLKIRLFEVSIM